MRTRVLVAAALGAVAMGGTSAFAYWATGGTGAGTASTTTLNPPSSSAVSAAGDTSSSVRVSVSSAPSSGAPVQGYRIDRTAPTAQTGACFITATTGSCSAAASGSGTQTYRVVSYRGTTSLQYWQSTPLTGITGTPLSSLAISGVTRDGGNKKVHFTGTGAAAGSQITVTICTVNSFPCAAGNSAGTSTVPSPTAGAWTSGQSTANLDASATYYAQAVQGSVSSAVFTFSTTNL